MNKEELKYKIETDPTFAIDFALDNNLGAILNLLQAKGYTGTDRAFAKQVLVSLLNSGEYKQVQQILDVTPYLDYVNNYTGGMQSYFMPEGVAQSPYASNQAVAGRFDLSAFLGALGSGLTTYSSATSTGGQVTNNGMYPSGYTPPKDYTWLWYVVGSIVVVTIIIVVVKNKNKK